MSKEAAVSFAVGDKFYTFEELEDKITRLKKATGVELWKSDVTTIQDAPKRFSGSLSEALQYYEVRYSCIRSSRKPKGEKANGDTKAVAHFRGCKAHVYLVASKDDDALVVRSFSNEHNHDIVPEKDDSEQVDEIDETADLNMMCCDITEVYPSSVIEMLLDGYEEEETVYIAQVNEDNGADSSVKIEDDGFIATIDVANEVTDTQLKQEIEELSTANSIVLGSIETVSPVSHQTDAAHDVQQGSADTGAISSQPVKKSYACDICGHIYARPKMLVKHRRKHETRPPSASSPKDGGTSVIKNGGYACGECGDRFDNEDEVKSHVFTKHMCLSKELGQNGEVQVVSILKPGITQLPSTAEKKRGKKRSENMPACEDNSAELTGLKSDMKDQTSARDDTKVGSDSDIDSSGCLRAVEDVEHRSEDVVGGIEDPSERSSLPQLSKLCPVCGKMFNNLRLHMRTHGHERPEYKCLECGRKFARSDYLKDHKRVHTKERLFLCGLCGRSYASLSNLRAHHRTHSDERRFPCNVCGKLFRRAYARNEHVRAVHEQLKAYRCSQCPQAFKTSNGLKLHVMGHTNERPYACPMCPKLFKSASMLDVHKSVHTGDRPFPCCICGRRFTQKSSARIHEMTQHTVDRGRCHECELCGQRFNKRSIRDAHVRRHKGEKPHKCTLCDWAFASAGDLRNHVIKKHKLKLNSSVGRPQQSVAENETLQQDSAPTQETRKKGTGRRNFPSGSSRVRAPAQEIRGAEVEK